MMRARIKDKLTKSAEVGEDLGEETSDNFTMATRQPVGSQAKQPGSQARQLLPPGSMSAEGGDAPGSGPTLEKKPVVELQEVRDWLRRAGVFAGRRKLEAGQPKPLKPLAVAPTARGSPKPLLQLERVQACVRAVVNFLGGKRRAEHEEARLRSKLPYSDPPPERLARGLVRLSDLEFRSEEERRAYVKQLRKRHKKPPGPLPMWTFMVPNVGLVWFLIVNPRMPWSPR
eukprot:jgi/Mesen1/4233/ME000022S03526